MIKRFFTFFAISILMFVSSSPAWSRDISIEQFQNLSFRHIGPEGNRTIAAAGVPGDPQTYYIAAASGGVWKSEDGGISWRPIFDDQDVSSIGALAVAPTNPEIVWAGSGETNVRSNISIGNGIYKSVDAGKTWQHMGLRKTGRIGRIVVHPENPDIVYVAALGTIYGPQQERGIFKTTNGGKTWERSLFTDPGTGGIELTMNPKNPDILIAGMWPITLNTWERTSGGPNGGLYMTRDAGKSWRKLTDGLPKGDIGNVSVDYAPSNPDIVYALLETDQYKFGGVLWRSDNGGEKWRIVSYDQEYNTRPHYYTRVVVAPDDPEEIFMLATHLSHSKDGGKTAISSQVHGGDEHDLWIDPTNPNRMLGANDQAVRITTDRGKSWRYINLPVAQMYHVDVDDQIPYFVYGNRQDGPTYRVPSRISAGGITLDIGGGETGFTFSDPFDNNIVWSSNEQGVLDRFDLKAGQGTNIQVWPETPIGRSPGDLKYRWIWSHPFIVSTNKRNTLYAGSQYVHKTTDGGDTWKVISPDLTLNDPAMQVNSGGLTYDNVGPEYGNTLYALAESPLNGKVLWAGSNDGLLHVTRNGGKKWSDVTEKLKGLPKLGTFTSIEASRYNEGTAYVTVDFHSMNNRAPYIYKTTDFGESWTKITNGIPKSALSYAHIIREDLKRPGLLYAGTENALYVSFDDGTNWQKFDNGLPPAPYRWIALQERYGDLVAGTYGRGYWILDDLTPLREATEKTASSKAHLFSLRDTYRLQARNLQGSIGFFDQLYGTSTYEDAESGAFINYYLASSGDDGVEFTVRDKAGNLVTQFEGPAEQGVNRVYWDLRHDSSPEVHLLTAPPNYPEAALAWFQGEFNEEGWRALEVEGSGPNGPLVVPGTYEIELKVGGVVLSNKLSVINDPLSPASLSDIKAQTALALDIRERVTELTAMGNAIQRVRKQLDDLQADNSVSKKLKAESEKLEADYVALESKFYVLNATGASENLLRFPGQLYSHLNMLGSYTMNGDGRPTKSKYEVYEELTGRLRAYEAEYDELRVNQLAAFNSIAKRAGVAPIALD